MRFLWVVLWHASTGTHSSALPLGRAPARIHWDASQKHHDSPRGSGRRARRTRTLRAQTPRLPSRTSWKKMRVPPSATA
eukprot:3248768-Pyramimonas_sp.AAC.1